MLFGLSCSLYLCRSSISIFTLVVCTFRTCECALHIYMCVCTLEAAGAVVSVWAVLCLCMFACAQHILQISRILELRLMLFTFWGRTFYVHRTFKQHSTLVASKCIWQCRFDPFLFDSTLTVTQCVWLGPTNEWLKVAGECKYNTFSKQFSNAVYTHSTTQKWICKERKKRREKTGNEWARMGMKTLLNC